MRETPCRLLTVTLQNLRTETVAKTTNSDVIKLQNCNLSFPELFKPRAFAEGQTPKYQAAFVFDPSDKSGAANIKKVSAAIKQVLTQHYGDGKVPKGIKLCLKDNEKEEKAYEGYEGKWFLNSSNQTRPTVVNRDLSPIQEDDAILHPGCLVNASIILWVQDNQYGKRVNATLRAVQYVGKGEVWGGSAPVKAEQDFEPLEAADDDWDDDIPF